MKNTVSTEWLLESNGESSCASYWRTAADIERCSQDSEKIEPRCVGGNRGCCQVTWYQYYYIHQGKIC